MFTVKIATCFVEIVAELFQRIKEAVQYTADTVSQTVSQFISQAISYVVPSSISHRDAALFLIYMVAVAVVVKKQQNLRIHGSELGCRMARIIREKRYLLLTGRQVLSYAILCAISFLAAVYINIDWSRISGTAIELFAYNLALLLLIRPVRIKSQSFHQYVTEARLVPVVNSFPLALMASFAMTGHESMGAFIAALIFIWCIAYMTWVLRAESLWRMGSYDGHYITRDAFKIVSELLKVYSY